MRMLVRVQVSGLKTGFDDLLYLSAQFIVWFELAHSQTLQELGDGRRQGMPAGQQRFATDQHQVTADVQIRIGVREFKRMLKLFAIRH